MNAIATTQAIKIDLFSLGTPQMRVFHISWMSFFVSFFGWFAVTPLMAIVREDLGLTQTQVGNTIIASVAITVLARPIIGWMCDRFGPRRTYVGLLVLGSIPVMAIGLADSYESFLLFRMAIGAIGASFVITQYHTSVMFAPNVVGTASATTAGWGNMGGGVVQIVIPLIFVIFTGVGYASGVSWRLAMIVPGIAMLAMAAVYYAFTQDYPEGDAGDFGSDGRGILVRRKGKDHGAFLSAIKDSRVWGLSLIYGACFGVELTIISIGAIYFMDYFGLGLQAAGAIAGLFGLMNIFARSLGGHLGDRLGVRFGLRARVQFLFAVVFLEGLTLIAFSRMTGLLLAVALMVLFSLFVKMAAGATFAVVPFVNGKAMGAVSGIVGAGGNAGAVLAGFLFANEVLTYPDALTILGAVVVGVSFCAFAVRFSEEEEEASEAQLNAALNEAGVGLPEVTPSVPSAA